MDNIQRGLKKRAEEINQLKAEINAILKDSDALKPAVNEFTEKRQKAKALGKLLREKIKEHKVLAAFFF